MLCVVVQTVIFGLGNVITKFAYESVTPLWYMVLRFGLALAAFALVFGSRMVRELRGAKLADWAPPPRSWRSATSRATWRSM